MATANKPNEDTKASQEMPWAETAEGKKSLMEHLGAADGFLSAQRELRRVNSEALRMRITF